MARGIARAMEKAAALLQVAADAGDTEAQFSLGLLYLTGRGVEQNLGEALKLFSLAQKSGDADAASFRVVVAEQLARERAAEQQRNEAYLATMMDAKRCQLFPKPKLVNTDS